MNTAKQVGRFAVRVGYLARATAWAALLGLIELVRLERGRRWLAALVLVSGTAAILLAQPLRAVHPGELGVRFNRLTGDHALAPEGYVLVAPGLHELKVFPLADQVYRPLTDTRDQTPFQTQEGLSIGVDVTIRYALDATRVVTLARRLSADIGPNLVEPVADGVLHRVFANHSVREIFSTRRAQIQDALTAELKDSLAPDGVLVRSVAIGKVELPAEYRKGLESLLAEELQSEKMQYTLDLKEKMVKQTELEAEAEKVRREKGAEASAQEEIIAARGRGEAMKHVLPYKEREIEQKRLEAEAMKAHRMKVAEGEAEARRIESAGEADARRQLADSEAYRLEVTGRASMDQLTRESALIRENPLLIQKAMADKLSDKVQVIIAPPQAGGFGGGRPPSPCSEPTRLLSRGHVPEHQAAVQL